MKISGLSFIALVPLFVAGNVFAHGISEADRQRMLESGPLDYIALGAGHMLTGYDHLLFLLGVIFFLSRFKDIVKFITAFTVGHSITLLFATLYGIKANYYIIDAVIALTVCYKGFENLDGFKKHLKMASPNLLAAVFIFGLIHGFGLSTRLQQLPLGDSGIVPKILYFNLGVEAGQIVALTVMIALISGWRKRESFKHFSRLSNRGLIVAGMLLMTLQLHGYLFDTHSDEPDHHHTHEEGESEAIRKAKEIYKGHKSRH